MSASDRQLIPIPASKSQQRSPTKLRRGHDPKALEVRPCLSLIGPSCSRLQRGGQGHGQARGSIAV